MNRRRFLRRVLVAAVGVPVFGPLVARAFNLATVSQRIRSYDSGTIGMEIPCGATTKVAAVEVAVRVEGVAPASSIKVLVALDGQPVVVGVRAVERPVGSELCAVPDGTGNLAVRGLAVRGRGTGILRPRCVRNHESLIPNRVPLSRLTLVAVRSR